MEKDKSGRIIAVVALAIGVFALSLGFAAYSSRLDITSNAIVQVGDDDWEVGFSNVTTGVATTTTTISQSGTSSTVSGASAGSIDLTQFTITQNTAPTLSTTNGSKVEYDFHIVNEGRLDAFLNAITMGSLSCEYVASGTTRTTDDGHTTIDPSGTGTISSEDCNAMFGVTLTIDSTPYTVSTNSGFGTTNQLLAPVSPATATNVAAKLTIAYKTDGISNASTAPNGDFIVTLGQTSVTYGTSSN